MASYKKLGRDFIYMFMGNMGSKVLAFLIVPFYTAVLTTEEYGIADLISTTVTLLFPFFSLIICEPMMRFALDKEKDPKEVWNAGCLVWLIGTGILLVLSPIVLLTPLKSYYVFVLLHYVTYSGDSCISYFVRGLNKVKIFAVSGMVQTVVTICANLIFLLVFRMGIEGYLISRILGSVISSVYMLIAAGVYKYGFSVKLKNKALQKEMLKYSIPMIPNSVSWWIANASDRYMLTAFSGAAVTGIYSVAYKIPTLVSTVSSLFGTAWKVNIVDDFGSEESRNFFSDVYSKLTALMVIMLSVLFMLNKPISKFLFSNDFYQAWQCVPLLLLSSVFHAYCDMLGSIYTSSYKTKFLVVSTAIGAGVNILFNLILIPRFGSVGAALATMLGYGTVWVARMIHSRSIMKLKINYARDVVVYILIAIQLYIVSNSFAYEGVASIVCLVIICAIMKNDMIGAVKLLKNKKKKKTV